MAAPAALSRLSLRALNSSARRLPAVLSQPTYSLLRSHHHVLQLRSFRSTQNSPLLLLTNFRSKSVPSFSSRPKLVRLFHSTPRNQGFHLFPFLASVLKASTALEVARTAGRIALTLAPILLFKRVRIQKWLDRQEMMALEQGGPPLSQETADLALNRMRLANFWAKVLLAIPVGLFCATLLASFERTPLTGRWRMIILSPEEEDDIAAQLAGPGWYKAVEEILAEDGEFNLVSQNDWRYTWVSDTFRRLESTIPILLREKELEPEWLKRGPDDIPLPPPAEYPLKPRPRVSEFLHRFCESMSHRLKPPVPHSIPGPPYSLLVVEKPDASNAFSYGFGPDGGGGVVVYSGFLDEVLSKSPNRAKPEEPPQQSWWTYIFGGAIIPPKPQQYIPTPEETSQLAILLSHELSHLILSHHLETLSFGKVIVPGVLSIATDVLRALLFPVTMLFGPFVNDAVAQIGKVGSGELLRMGEYCGADKQEIEADIVSTRLLAYAGFDARDAPKFWENKSHCSGTEKEDPPPGSHDTFVRRIMGESHPMNEARVQKLREELDRWRAEREAALNGEW